MEAKFTLKFPTYAVPTLTYISNDFNSKSVKGTLSLSKVLFGTRQRQGNSWKNKQQCILVQCVQLMVTDLSMWRKTSFGYTEGVDTIRSSQKMNSTKKKFLALHNSSLTWFVPVWIQLKKNLDGQHLLLRGRRHNPRVQVSIVVFNLKVTWRLRNIFHR